MFIQVYGTTLAVILASLIVGEAICGFGGTDRRWWAAPSVGLGTLIVVAGAAIKLPGHDLTAFAALVIVVFAALALVVRRGLWHVGWPDFATGGIALLIVSLPFIANGRIGVLGVSLDNDLSNHLVWAESLRSGTMNALYGTGGGYPLGPHSLADAFSGAFGMSLDRPFTGILVAVLPITALSAQGLLGDATAWRRILIGVVPAIAYLLAAYYGEGSFKETILAGALLGFVVHLEQVRTVWTRARARHRFALMVPAVLIATGAVYTYSYVGAAWFALTLVLWGVGAVLMRPSLLRRWRSRNRWIDEAPWVAGTVVFGIVLVLPIASQVLTFFNVVGFSPASGGPIPASSLGNLEHPLPGYESLGIWLSPDFRVDPSNIFHAGELSAFALAALVYGFVWAITRRELLLPAAAAACVVIWWRSDRTQAPYVTAKSLAIASPLFVAVVLRSLLTPRTGSVSSRTLALLAAGAFCVLGALSTYKVLTDMPVQAPEAGRELAAYQREIGKQRVLFLGNDDFATWQLRDAAVTGLTGGLDTNVQATARPNKPTSLGPLAIDFDSVVPADLDHFRYIITANGAYASQPPANFRLVASRSLYDLWERSGPTVPRDVIDPAGAPGAVLDCKSPASRKLLRQGGVASIMPTPVVVPGTGMPPGGSTSVSLPLPAGHWDLSIQYTSAVTMFFGADRKRWTMPAYLGRQGPFFRLGTVSSSGPASPTVLSIHADKPSLLTGDVLLYGSVQLIAATRVPDTHQTVSLSRACGRYVDWYRPLT